MDSYNKLLHFYPYGQWFQKSTPHLTPDIEKAFDHMP